MIRLLSHSEALEYLESNSFSIYDIKLASQLHMYAQDRTLLDVWAQECGGVPQALFSRLGGHLILSGHTENVEELEAFVKVLGCPAEGEAELLALVHPYSIQTGPLMRLPLPVPPSICKPGASVHICPAPSLEQVFRLLQTADLQFAGTASYEAWLVELSHKCRHQLAEVYTLFVDNRLVSTASILFRHHTAAIVGMVATDPAYQGRGYAGILLHAIAQAAYPAQDCLYLMAASDPLEAFYRKQGWQPDRRWARCRFSTPHPNTEGV